MAAPVLPLQPVKLASGPADASPDQAYWKSFKAPTIYSVPHNSPVTHISTSSTATARATDYFAVTAGTRVQLYSALTRKLVKTITRFEDVAHSAEIRRDGRVMVAGDDGGTIQVFDTNSRAILRTWKEHKQAVWTTKFSPQSQTSLMSTCDDRTVKLWDLPSQQSVSSFTGHQDYVRCGEYMSGQASSLLVSGSYDQMVKIWDPRASASAVMTFKHPAPIESVLSMPSGTAVVAASDNEIHVLDLVAAKSLHVLKNHQKTVTSLCFASGGTRLVSAGLDGHLKIFEMAAWHVVFGIKYPSQILAASVIKAAGSQDDKHLVVGMQSGSLSIRTRLSGPQKAKEKARQKEMEALVDGNTVKLRALDAKKQTKGYQKRHRGESFLGEGADIVIEGRSGQKPRLKQWEKLLRKGKYNAALDEVLQSNNFTDTVTVLTALRHRSATRTALLGRDEATLQPIYQWICKHITDPRYVNICVDLGLLILDLYADHMGESSQIDHLTSKLHKAVRLEVERSQQAWQTNGMIEMLMSIDS